MVKGEGKVVAQNKKAHHDYTIVDTLKAGMVLTGTEIKSVRAARINLKDGFAQVKNGEVWLSNVHIAPYEEGNIWNQEPERRRKLLLHKKQIQKLEQETKGTGMTLVPLKVYIKDGYAKLLAVITKRHTSCFKRANCVHSQRLGVSAVVENKAGAGGAIGLGAIAKAVPGGRTFGFASVSPVALLPHLGGKMPFDPQKDLTPAASVLASPVLLLATPANHAPDFKT